MLSKNLELNDKVSNDAMDQVKIKANLYKNSIGRWKLYEKFLENFANLNLSP